MWFEAFFKAIRQTLVGVLGLNAIRPEDGSGNPKATDKMTDEEREAFLPLVAWVGRPELLKMAAEQIEKDIDPAKVTGDEAYEKMVEAIDAADGDMVPVLENVHGVDLSKLPVNSQLSRQKDLLNIKDRSELDKLDIDMDI